MNPLLASYLARIDRIFDEQPAQLESNLQECLDKIAKALQIGGEHIPVDHEERGRGISQNHSAAHEHS